MHGILTVAGKDILLLWRDRIGFCWWIVGFPLLIAVVIGAIFSGMVGGQTQPLAVAFIDEDGGPDAEAFLARLEQSKLVSMERLDRAAAETAVRRGRLAAGLAVKPGFTLSPALLTTDKLPLTVTVDPSAGVEGAYLVAVLKETLFRLVRERFLSAGGDGSAAGGPSIEVVRLSQGRSRPRSSFELCFPLGMIWGIVGLTAEFAHATARERNVGTYLRLRAAPVSRASLLAGSALACLAVAVGVQLLLLAVGRGLFGVRWHDLTVLGMAIGSVAVMCTGLAILFSVTACSEVAVQGLAWATLLVLTLVGGGMVPRIFMPEWMETASQISPVSWALLALEGGVWRGFTVAEVAGPCAKLLGAGVAFFAAAEGIVTVRQR